MFSTKNQIEYWKSGTDDDLLSAKILIDENRLLHGLFFCHLAIEKAIKAHVVKQTNTYAPRSNNLIFLLETANLEMVKEDETLLAILMKYHLHGRYPDFNPVIPEKSKVKEYLIRTENLLIWLKERL